MVVEVRCPSLHGVEEGLRVRWWGRTTMEKKWGGMSLEPCGDLDANAYI